MSAGFSGVCASLLQLAARLRKTTICRCKLRGVCAFLRKAPATGAKLAHSQDSLLQLCWSLRKVPKVQMGGEEEHIQCIILFL